MNWTEKSGNGSFKMWVSMQCWKSSRTLSNPGWMQGVFQQFQVLSAGIVLSCRIILQGRLESKCSPELGARVQETAGLTGSWFWLVPLLYKLFQRRKCKRFFLFKNIHSYPQLISVTPLQWEALQPIERAAYTWILCFDSCRLITLLSDLIWKQEFQPVATLWHTCFDAREWKLLGKPSFPCSGCRQSATRFCSDCVWDTRGHWFRAAHWSLVHGALTHTGRKVLGPGGDSADGGSVPMLKQELPCYLLKKLIAVMSCEINQSHGHRGFNSSCYPFHSVWNGAVSFASSRLMGSYSTCSWAAQWQPNIGEFPEVLKGAKCLTLIGNHCFCWCTWHCRSYCWALWLFHCFAGCWGLKITFSCISFKLFSFKHMFCAPLVGNFSVP